MSSRKISVLHVTRSISSNGGIEEYLRTLCSRLDKNTFRIGICSIQDSPDDIPPHFKALGIELFCCGESGTLLNPFTTKKVQGIIREFGADIVHTHTDKGNFHGRLAARKAKVPVVTTHHDLGDIIFSKTRHLRRKFNFSGIKAGSGMSFGFFNAIAYPFFNVRFNRMNERVVCVSNVVRQVYTANQGDKKFVTVYSPYDETLFAETYQGLQNETVVLGVVGRLVPQKGHAVLLRSLRKLLEEGVSVQLRIIGDGFLRTSLEEECRNLGINRNVSFLGDLPHDAHLYDGIDIYLQPSFMEGCSISLLEAMAQGIPVVATDCGGPSELIEDGETGLLIPPGDSHLMAVGIMYFIENRSHAIEMGRKGAERARAGFTSEVFVRKMKSLYHDVLNKVSRKRVRK